MFLDSVKFLLSCAYHQDGINLFGRPVPTLDKVCLLAQRSTQEARNCFARKPLPSCVVRSNCVWHSTANIPCPELVRITSKCILMVPSVAQDAKSNKNRFKFAVLDSVNLVACFYKLNALTLRDSTLFGREFSRPVLTLLCT